MPPSTNGRRLRMIGQPIVEGVAEALYCGRAQ